MTKQYAVYLKRNDHFYVASKVFNTKEKTDLKRIDMQLETNNVLITREL